MTYPRCTQSWRQDFQAMISGVIPGYQGTPYAFVRFGDGESAIISGRKYQTKADGWSYPGGDSELSRGLYNSLSCSTPGYFVGLPSPTFEPEHLKELIPFVRVPYNRVTWAKLFIDTNYKHFRSALPLFVSSCVTVASSPGADYFVPANGVHPFWGDRPIDVLVDDLRETRKPILVSA